MKFSELKDAFTELVHSKVYKVSVSEWGIGILCDPLVSFGNVNKFIAEVNNKFLQDEKVKDFSISLQKQGIFSKPKFYMEFFIGAEWNKSMEL